MNVLGSSILGSVLSLIELLGTRYYLFMYFQDSGWYHTYWDRKVRQRVDLKGPF